jgi:hypothetical protein
MYHHLAQTGSLKEGAPLLTLALRLFSGLTVVLGVGAAAPTPKTTEIPNEAALPFGILYGRFHPGDC